MLLLAEADKTANPLLPALPDIIWSVVVLVVVGLVLGKYVIPKFLKVLDERTEKIEGGIARAEEAQEKAQELLQQYQAEINKARDEAAIIREEARAEGQALLAQMKVEAQAESERIIATGNSQLEIQRRQIISELRNDLGRISISLAEKLIGHALDTETKKAETIDRFITELDAAG